MGGLKSWRLEGLGLGIQVCSLKFGVQGFGCRTCRVTEAALEVSSA